MQKAHAPTPNKDLSLDLRKAALFQQLHTFVNEFVWSNFSDIYNTVQRFWLRKNIL